MPQVCMLCARAIYPIAEAVGLSSRQLNHTYPAELVTMDLVASVRKEGSR